MAEKIKAKRKRQPIPKADNVARARNFPDWDGNPSVHILSTISTKKFLKLWEKYKEQEVAHWRIQAFCTFLGIHKNTMIDWRVRRTHTLPDGYDLVFQKIADDIEAQNLMLLKDSGTSNAGMFLLKVQSKYMTYEKAEELRIREKEIDNKAKDNEDLKIIISGGSEDF